MPYKRFLGYEKGEDELPQIIEKEATVVRLIYKLFLEGNTPSSIAAHLTNQGIHTPSGKVRWQPSTVQSILTNEKYKGDAILQKSFTVDFLTKKQKINEGEVPQYYIENSHPAIITPEVFDLVQHEMKKRKSTKGYKTSGVCFSGKIVCGECGSFYGSKVWHSTSKYRRTIWQCNHKFKSDNKCGTPHLYEGTLKAAFLEAFNNRIENKDDILIGYKTIIQGLTDTSALDKKSDKLQDELMVVAELMRKSVEENAHEALDQTEYQKHYSSLIERYENAKKEIGEINDERLERNAKRENIEAFILTLERGQGILTEFDEGLWNATIEFVTIHSEHDISFTFKDGMELNWEI